MNFYFIGNNPDNKTFMKKKIFMDNDIVIVFNHNMYKNYKSFINAKNKIHFYRSGGPYHFWGRNIIDKCTCKKFLLRKNKLENIFNIDSILTDNKHFKKLLKNHNYTKEKKSPQSGSMAFHFLENNTNICNPENNIYLVGFTSIYKNGLSSCHSKKLEDAYWNYIMKKYDNIHKI